MILLTIFKQLKNKSITKQFDLKSKKKFNKFNGSTRDQWMNDYLIVYIKKKMYLLRLIMKKLFNNFNIWNTIENNWKNLYITVFILIFVWCWYIQVLFYFKFCLIYIFYCSQQNNPKMPLSYCSVFFPPRNLLNFCQDLLTWGLKAKGEGQEFFFGFILKLIGCIQVFNVKNSNYLS